MSLILAFDTSTLRGSVAILDGDRVLARNAWERQGSHGEMLTPQIIDCLADAGLKNDLRRLTAIAIGVGPGSFTGVRVAVNAARSLGFALDKEIHAFDTLEVLAAGCPNLALPVLAVVNAQKNSIFGATFRFDERSSRWRNVEPLRLRAVESLPSLIHEKHVCVGDGFLEYQEDLSRDVRLVRDAACDDFPSAETIGRLAQHPRFSRPLDWKAIHPLYIRESAAEEKLRESRAKNGPES